MRRINKPVVAIAAAALVLGTAGVAFAYWTTTGDGDGSASTAESNGTVALVATFEDGLAPGQDTDVVYTASNTSDTDLWIDTIHAVVTTDPSACDAADFSIADVEYGDVVLAGALDTEVGTGSLVFANSDQNQDDCKGAEITLTLSTVAAPATP